MADLGFIFYHHIQASPIKNDDSLSNEVYANVMEKYSYRMQEDEIHSLIEKEIKQVYIKYKAKTFDKEMKDFLE